MSAVDIEDVKRHLRIAVDTYDTQLQATIDAAEDAIAQKCGPLEPTAVTERVNGGGCALVLNRTPVISLTSVTPVGGAAYNVADLQVHESSGVVEWVFPAYFVVGRYDVVYQSGRETLPGALKEAVLELTRELWEPQRGGSTRAGSRPVESDPIATAGAGIERLRRVQDLIRPYVQVGN